MLTREAFVEQLGSFEGVRENMFAGKKGMVGVAGEFPVMTLAGKEHRLSSEALSRLCRTFGIPESYARKCPMSLLIPHIDYWLEQEAKDFKAFVKGDEILAITKPSVELVPNTHIFQKIEAAIPVQASEFDNVRLSYENTQFGMVFPAETAMEVGDVVKSGIQVQNSYFGDSPLMISGYIYRLVCSNGLISAEHTYRFVRRSADTIDIWIEEMTKIVYGNLDTEINRFKETKNVTVGAHITQAINSLFDEYEIPASLKQLVLDKFIEEQGRTLYDLINVITSLVHDEGVRDNKSLVRKLQMIGGSMMTHKRVCPQCSSVIRRG